MSGKAANKQEDLLKISSFRTSLQCSSKVVSFYLKLIMGVILLRTLISFPNMFN